MCKHFHIMVVTLNPFNNQTGKRHFSCVSMATNQNLHITLVTAVHWYDLCKTIFLLFFFGPACRPTFLFCLWAETWILYVFLSNAQFYQSQDLCQMPTDDFFFNCWFYFCFFLSTIFVYVFQLTLQWLPWASNSSASAMLNLKTCPAKIETLTNRDRSLNRIENNWEVLRHPL